MSEFESIAILTGDDHVDEVYACVKRTINGSDVRYIERFKSRDFSDDLTDAWFVDCGGSGTRYYQPAYSVTETVETTVGGYPVLRIADGTFSVRTPKTDLTHTLAISSYNDLANIANNYAGNYYLTTDIDAAGQSWTALPGSFTGTLDGCGYTISNLTITSGYGGLFLDCKGAVIANLTLEDINYSCIGGGGLVYYLTENTTTASEVYNCHTSGTITYIGQSNGASSPIGGMVGQVTIRTTGTIMNFYDCTSSVVIDAYSSHNDDHPRYEGGFVGRVAQYALFSNCRASGNVIAHGVTGAEAAIDIAGFVGRTADAKDYILDFNDCSATGDVEADNYAGGFIGEGGSGSNFTRCSARGDVTASDSNAYAGGFIATDGSNGECTDCYAWGNVIGGDTTGQAGGFITTVINTQVNCYSIGTVTANTIGGFSTASEGDTSCYWDTEASGTAISSSATGYDTETMKTQSTYIDWDFDTVWVMDSTTTETTTTTNYPESYGTTPTGYAHLEGETVNILADGVKYPQQVVTNGDIDRTLFPNVTDEIVGLPVKYKLMPQEMNYGDLAFILTKNISEVALNLVKSLDGRIGTDEDNSDKLDYSYDNYDSSPVLHTGTIEMPFKGNYTNTGDILIWDDGPLPFTVLGLAITMEVTDV